MRIWNSLTQAKKDIFDLKKGTAVTIGNYDGIHRGHQAIIRQNIELAKAMDVLSVVVTFANHTDGYFGEKPLLINQPVVRRERLLRLGLDAMLEVEFNQEFAKTSPELFFQNWLVDGLQALAIVEGHDFRFGYQGQGDFFLLQKLCAAQNIKILQVPPVFDEGEVISSSKIRQLISDGKIEKANQMLGYPFEIAGEVAYGEQHGRRLGFPTANIHVAAEYLLPAYGVYFVSFHLDGAEFFGVAGVGVKPTFGEYTPRVEVYLFDFHKDIYHQTARVRFLRYIRPELRFPNAEALKKQIEVDVEMGKNFLAKISGENSSE